MSAYYLLGYNSSNTSKDGKFRKISVKLRNTSSGYKLEARNGYYATADFAHLKKEDRARQLQEQIAAAVSSTDLPVVASTSWFRVANDRFYVPVSIGGARVSPPRADCAGAGSARTRRSICSASITDEQGRGVGASPTRCRFLRRRTDACRQAAAVSQSASRCRLDTSRSRSPCARTPTGTMGTFEFPITIPDLKSEPIKVSPVVLSTQLRFMRGGGPGGARRAARWTGGGGPRAEAAGSAAAGSRVRAAAADRNGRTTTA
jgi:hypothetical protein